MLQMEKLSHREDRCGRVRVLPGLCVPGPGSDTTGGCLRSLLTEHDASRQWNTWVKRTWHRVCILNTNYKSYHLVSA